MNRAHPLPSPSPEALQHSLGLIDSIRAEIVQKGGAIPFVRYMELALYAPGLGYYSAGSRKLGGEGDFTTAPELSPLFSRTLAIQISQLLPLMGGNILEFGAGSGVMAVDILLELERLGQLPQHYQIMELSGDLRQRQYQLIEQHCPHLLDRVEWHEQLPDTGFRGVIIANELLDAMPVHRFLLTEQGAQEIYVGWDGDGFVPQLGPLSCQRLAGYLSQLMTTQQLPVGYSSEVNLAALDWVTTLAPLIDQAVVLLIDYGFSQHEYYHPQRQHGTLMCHYRHHSHADPLILTGLQDITAHVDFTAVADAALASGLEVRGYTSQANFLLGCGITGLLAGEQGTQQQRWDQSQQLQRLTQPHEMGELFKVIALAKGFHGPLLGFSINDARGRL